MPQAQPSAYAPRPNAQRGLPDFDASPTREEPEGLAAFSYYDGSIRVTFRKRHHGPDHNRGKRQPTWEGYVSTQGRTVSAYAGNSVTFDLTKALCKLRDAVGLTR
jgi:hypothetical protein